MSQGPFETERQARTAAHAIVAPDDGWSILHGPQNRLLLERACNAAGVDLGAHDRRILDWLSGYEDSTCSVIAGLIARAAGKGPEMAPTPGGEEGHQGAKGSELVRTPGSEDEKGVAAADTPGARLAGVRGVLAAFDWEHDDRQYALEHIDAIVNGGAA